MTALRPTEPRRALLVVNGNSRQGGTGAEAVTRALEADLDIVSASCDSADDLSPCIVSHRDEVDCVIIGGGDGTLNAALGGLLDTGLPLGVLPLGTANDLTRSVGIPHNLAAAARVIVEGVTREVDVGFVNAKPFFNVASVGLAADLAKSLTTDVKRRFGRLGYALTAAHLLARARPFHATLITGEGKVLVKTLQVAVGNGRFYGGGNVVVTDAKIDDGRLDLYSLEFSQIWRMALMARSFQRGSHGTFREVRTAQGDTFEVVTRKPRPVNADGELVTWTPAVFTQRSNAVRIYVPRSSLPHPDLP